MLPDRFMQSVLRERVATLGSKVPQREFHVIHSGFMYIAPSREPLLSINLALDSTERHLGCLLMHGVRMLHFVL